MGMVKHQNTCEIRKFGKTKNFRKKLENQKINETNGQLFHLCYTLILYNIHSDSHLTTQISIHLKF